MKLEALTVYVRTHERLEVGFLAWWYPWLRGHLKDVDVPVPCDGCVACCLKTDVEMVGVDNPRDYRVEMNTATGAIRLQKRADGACTHLTDDNRCEVYARRPFMCRVFDCRVYPATSTVVLDRAADGDITLACEAGLTRFAVVARTAADRIAMDAVLALRHELTERNGFEAEVAVGAALMTWPRHVGGPALQYLRELERTMPPRLRSALVTTR